MREGMRLMVDWQACGFTLCGEASSAQEALRLVDALRPHLLITDVRMPGMLGTDLASIVSYYHPEVVILFFSGFRDFSYAQSAIRAHAFGYLIKPIDAEEVRETLLRVKAELDARAPRAPADPPQAALLRDQVLRRLAMGDCSPESLMRAAVLLELKRGDPCYCAVLSRERGGVPDSVRLLLPGCGAVPFQLSYGQVGLCFRQAERDLTLLARLQEGFGAGAPLTVCVGDVHRGAEGFGKSLREALDAQGVLFEPAGGLRLYRPFDAQTAAWYARAPLTELRAALLSECPHKLDTLLAEWARAVEADQPDLFALRFTAAALDALLPARGESTGGSPLRPLWQENPPERRAWLAAFRAALQQLHGASSPAPDCCLPPPVLAALDAIRTGYAQALNIGDVAEALHLNPAYLGQLVRRHTGATFHRRLLETRIDHACVLLRQTAQPVGEIAQEVGFRDVDYFSQQFRGRTGMSPMAYRCAEAAREEGEHGPHQ